MPGKSLRLISRRRYVVDDVGPSRCTSLVRCSSLQSPVLFLLLPRLREQCLFFILPLLLIRVGSIIIPCNGRTYSSFSSISRANIFPFLELMKFTSFIQTLSNECEMPSSARMIDSVNGWFNLNMLPPYKSKRVMKIFI